MAAFQQLFRESIAAKTSVNKAGNIFDASGPINYFQDTPVTIKALKRFCKVSVRVKALKLDFF